MYRLRVDSLGDEVAAASSQMRRAIGRVLEGELQEDLELIAAKDHRLAQEEVVPLRKDGRVYYKHIDDLTREDVAARLEAERVTAMWLIGCIEGERIAASCARKVGTYPTPTPPKARLQAAYW